MEETWELQLRFVLITLPIFLCVSLQYDVIPNKNKAAEWLLNGHAGIRVAK